MNEWKQGGGEAHKSLLSFLPFLHCCLFIGALLQIACGGGEAPSKVGSEKVATFEDNLHDCVEVYDPETDYFPEKATLDHAEEFIVEYHKHFKVLRLRTGSQEIRDAINLAERDAGKYLETDLTFLLVQCGTPSPDLQTLGLSQKTRVVEIPIKTVVTTSTTELPHFAHLGLADKVIGHAGADLVSTPEIRRRIERGEIVDVGRLWHEMLDAEKILELDPDLLFATGLDEFATDSAPSLRASGMTIVETADFLEVSPLGRAEWIYFPALFFNREAEASSFFAMVEERYRDLAGRVREADLIPQRVVAGGLYGEKWLAPGGRSHFVWLLADAGGEYVWAENPGSRALQVSPVIALEQLENLTENDFWLHPTWNSLSEMYKIFPELTDAGPPRARNIYQNDARMVGMGNDFWETGIARPDLVLADFIKILHPELLPAHRLIYHRRVD